MFNELALAQHDFFNKLHSMNPVIEQRVSINRFVSNIREEDDKYILDIEAPGMDKKDIDISIENGYLTISGKKKIKNEFKKEDYILIESSYGSFERSFKLPKNINPDEIKADFKKGILEIIIPKDEKKPEIKKIEIK